MSSQTESWMPLNILKPTVICKFNIPGKSAFFFILRDPWSLLASVTRGVMAVKRDRSTDCYCHPQSHSHAMWNFLSDGHCSVKNLECQKRQLESSFITKPNKVYFNKRRLLCQKWAWPTHSAILLTYRLQEIASLSHFGRRCAKQSPFKLEKKKKAST